jgi:hypothetical protein
MKLKTAAYNNRVSWYSVSSPLEWFAEQYTHYYRTEKTGGGLIDGATKTLLDRLDTQSFAPTNASGSTGVVYGADGGTSAATGNGGQGGVGQTTEGGIGDGGARAGAANRGGAGAGGGAPGGQPQVEPLFFPW